MQLQSDLQTTLMLYRDTSLLDSHHLTQTTLLTTAAEIHTMALAADDFIQLQHAVK